VLIQQVVIIGFPEGLPERFKRKVDTGIFLQ
jgi:hypothetical protein